MRRLPALVLATALLVPLAACGGDDGDDETSSSASASGTEDDGTTTTEAQEEDEPSGDAADFCAGVEDIVESDISEDLDFEDEDDLRAAVAILEDLAEDAPSAIEDDFDVVLDFFEIILDDFDDFQDPTQSEALQEEFADELADFNEATDALDEFSLDECGITIDGTTADGSDGGGGTGGSDLELGDPSSPPDATEEGLLDDSVSRAQLASLMADCEDGNLVACDGVFAATSVGSPEEEYGSTCGGRLDPEDGVSGRCEERFG